ncbi:mitochondrial 37S ribosomal protein uS13m [Dipodascopsis tothii]|uniref:mitochondrial 37S ribosomal protein uS13m n=1 Tax=Dipodascopsis tothii TaxID=44089 RepID=UPI0034CE3D26
MVVRIDGKKIRGNAIVRLALATKFYALGKQNAQKICSKLGFYPYMRAHELTEQNVLSISKELSYYTIEDEAKAVMRANIARQRDMGSYIGRRHAMHLPVRGQRTKKNAETARRLNRLERRAFSTQVPAPAAPSQRLFSFLKWF